MTSDRPYRAALTGEKATDEILSHDGSQFDPKVVRAFCTRERQLHRIYEAFSVGGRRPAAARPRSTGSSSMQRGSTASGSLRAKRSPAPGSGCTAETHTRRRETSPQEGLDHNRIKRAGFGFRNFDNCRLRLLLHCGTAWHT
jgi:hypothetical protein